MDIQFTINTIKEIIKDEGLHGPEHNAFYEILDRANKKIEELEKSKPAGDSGYVAEELLSMIPEVEQKCRVVQKAIEGGYFPIKQAMVAYSVTEIEFIKYLLTELSKTK